MFQGGRRSKLGFQLVYYLVGESIVKDSGCYFRVQGNSINSVEVYRLVVWVFLYKIFVSCVLGGGRAQKKISRFFDVRIFFQVWNIFRLFILIGNVVNKNLWV